MESNHHEATIAAQIPLARRDSREQHVCAASLFIDVAIIPDCWRCRMMADKQSHIYIYVYIYVYADIK